ncbi:MAG: polyphosphate kinase 1 [Fimbriimonas sp.]
MKRPTPTEAAEHYLNRELSWLRFNARVLSEAVNPLNPLLERAKFLAIFESNLDEFYMVRVSGLIEQFESGVLDVSPDGLTTSEQLQVIADAARPLRQEASRILSEDIFPQLRKASVHITPFSELTERQSRDLHAYFMREVFPLCTPLILHPAPSVPFISNRSLNLAVELVDGASETKLARVKVPSILPRFIKVPGRRLEFVLLEDLIAHHLQSLFPGVTILGSYTFRVIRDADIEIRELEAPDLVSGIEETLRRRRFGDPVLLEHVAGLPDGPRKVLMSLLKLEDDDVFAVDGLLGMECLWELAKIDKPALRFPAHVPYLAEPLSHTDTLFETISKGDFLVHHPFDSFKSVEEFVGSATKDPNVVGIKQTLYRVGSESPIVESLLDAAEAGKQVAVMVELKARFDESNNLVWARALERAGVHVTYGFADLKTHCKLCLLVRREKGGTRSYAHIGTGNYNPSTARIYTDIGLFTCDEAITQDISELFNYLTGFSKQNTYRKLLVAPVNLREGILDRIRREANHARTTGNGRIIFKVNALVDPEVIEALYEANQAGVEIDLIVRGICCLRPGVPGLSERIRVVSIVGRFLEHSRIYYFANENQPDVFIGSADCMRRNLDRRVEVLVPVEKPELIAYLHDELLIPCMKDNVRAWSLGPDGEYARRIPGPAEKLIDTQTILSKRPCTKVLFGTLGSR